MIREHNFQVYQALSSYMKTISAIFSNKTVRNYIQSKTVNINFEQILNSTNALSKHLSHNEIVPKNLISELIGIFENINELRIDSSFSDKFNFHLSKISGYIRYIQSLKFNDQKNQENISFIHENFKALLNYLNEFSPDQYNIENLQKINNQYQTVYQMSRLYLNSAPDSLSRQFMIYSKNIDYLLNENFQIDYINQLLIKTCNTLKLFL
ncbi:hypothetical protein TRFO_10910 [Tritrichomonas foetus]|uniref:Uncharacterized protein n=1 Tax=Tritrichomonas foetus TaxID=1144522 RepID=A0A1J4JBW2_9EUKA|nr:hypothetical protein TRFO_10910 [Tritrichomonas foetus]|eukprot:OHS94748.1 hypothetical protein TRFO_10910 [Tritrichomonas foetus]